MEYDNFCDLEVSHKQEWNIEVRLARRWEEIDIENGQVRGIHLVFIDASHKRMHCWIKSTLIEQLDAKFVPGEMYAIHNFIVAPFTEKYKCFEADKQIILTNLTIVTKLQGSYSLIPQNVFEFTNLKKIPTAEEQDTHLIDIVGIVQNVQPISPVTRGLNKAHRVIKFEVTDLIHNVNICFWDDFATNFEDEYNEQLDHPVILTISSCRMIRNNYTGLTTVRNASATSFEMNANVERVQTLRSRFWEVHGI
ncbi:hypothetical protein POM88_032960 [Heracleum sosnowskyi]|uniref:Replication protein A 70 kDa DNA-binding subunit B/D first OB fold domain-containing protein n=1 Tax=Heracleum sosnowskyi TaxID=360622 RepID=A0AAD8I2D6_9APIA|nr:hypothetical protein POM88_032960 [Heracleum sosnowskyi]